MKPLYNDNYSKMLMERALAGMTGRWSYGITEEKDKCNHSGAGTSCPTHGDADCNSSKKNRAEQVELMPEELVGTTYEAVLETGETIILEKEKGLDGKACWKGYKQVGTKMEGGKRVDDCVKAGYEPSGDPIQEKKDMPGSQEKIDANKNGKVDAHDFAILRNKKSKKTVKEMWQIAAEAKVQIEVMPELDDKDPANVKKKEKKDTK